MRRKTTPEIAQEKHKKKMDVFVHLNTLREEIVEKIDADPHLTFKKMDHKQKIKELGSYFRGNRFYFNMNTKADDVITHFRERNINVNFLVQN